MYGNDSKAQQIHEQRFGTIQGYADKALDQAAATLGTRQPEVMGELRRLECAVDRLAKISDVLADKLQPIRRQTGINGTAGGGMATAATPVMCSLAGNIRDRREAIERYCAQLEAATGELEI